MSLLRELGLGTEGWLLESLEVAGSLRGGSYSIPNYTMYL
jgi:hypothetical protein